MWCTMSREEGDDSEVFFGAQPPHILVLQADAAADTLVHDISQS